MTDLSEVLAKIAEIEDRPGYEGPRITTALSNAVWRIYGQTERFSLNEESWAEDIIVGTIVRAAKSHRNPDSRLEDWMIDIEDGGDGGFIVFVKNRLGHKIGVEQGPLALAAARAYLAAIEG